MESESAAAGGELSFSQIGMKARSPEGHAAKAMNIKGDEYVWIEIQQKTFTNWVNEQLRSVGESVKDLQTDLCDGLRLISLIEALQKKKLKRIKRPINQHQCLENVQTALTAMAADNIKLVNIGNTDIVEGNLKLILGLVWSLILRYQIGRTSFPPKKLMLAWLKAVIPDAAIHNFTSDWNSGISLSALLEYCKPGVFPHWRNLNARNSIENCQFAMQTAKDEFGIPMILTPEDLASHNLDELSCMTYLSYFMNEGSPGYKSTLKWVQKQIPQLHIKNFTSDWNDGLALCSLVHSLGAVIDLHVLSRERSQWEYNLQKGINGGKYLGVEPLLKAKELANPELEPLGLMAYIARFQWLKPRKKPRDKISITGTDLNSVHVNKPAHFKIHIQDSSVDIKQIRAEVRSPTSSLVECKLQMSKIGGTGIFVPLEIGMHELRVYCENELVTGCPLHIRVHPDISRILFSGIDPCALGSLVEVLINSNGAGSGNIHVEAVSPTGKTRECAVKETNGVYTSTFTPNEIGEWKIEVTYSGEHIQGSPFTCYVYDPTKVKVKGLDSTQAGQEITFICDASDAGWGKVNIEVQLNGRSIPLQIDERGNGVYRVTLTPNQIGRYQVFATFNNLEVRGSPFTLNVSGHDSEIRESSMESITSKRMTSKIEKIPSPIITPKSSQFVSSFKKEETAFKSQLSSNMSYSQDRLDSLPSYSKPLTKGDSFMSTSSSRSHEKQSPSKIPISRFSNSYQLSSSSKMDRSSSESEIARTSHEEATVSFSPMSSLNEIPKPPKAPPPPTAKKPSAMDAAMRSWLTREAHGGSFDLSQTHSTVDEKSESKTFQKKLQKWTSKEDIPKSSIPTLQSDVNGIHRDKLYRQPSASSDNISIASAAQKLEEKLGASKNVLEMSRSFMQKSKGDISQVKISGEALKLVPVKRPTTFKVIAHNFEQDDISVTVTAPSGREIPFRMDVLQPGEFEVEFITPEVGEHTLEILVAGKPLPGSPFRSHAYDASKIKVGKVPNGVVGKPVEFEIDGADAGSGNLEIMVNGGHVTSQVKSLGNHRFLASFIPHTATTHSIDMKFNGEKVQGSPWMCEVNEGVKKASVTGNALHSFSCGKSTSFEINAPGCRKEDINVNITGPGKSSVQCKVTEQRQDIYKVEFSTFEAGTYIIDTNISGQRLPGSPFTAKAYDASKIVLNELPQSFIVGQMSQFQVDASRAGEGQLEISVNRGEVPNQVQVLSSGRCLVSFKAVKAIPHTINIKFNGETVPGCPITLQAVGNYHVSVDLSDLELVPVNCARQFYIDAVGGNEDDLKVTITSPSDAKIPVKLLPSSRGGFNVEFTPKEVGPHVVAVDYCNNPVTGSPGTVKVYDAQKVLVSSVAQSQIGKTVQFVVDASSSGEGNLEITVSARNRNIPTQVHPMGGAKFAVSFVPNELSDHIISINFNKEPVPGSPFKVKIQDFSKVTAIESTISAVSVQKTAVCIIQNAEGKEQDLSVKVEAPDGSSIPFNLKGADGSNLKVEFSPSRTGEHKIHISHLGTPISGSPFMCKVFDNKQIKVREIPVGIIGKPVTFIVETAHAGPGNLEVMVNNGQVPTTPQAQSPTQYAITFTPKEQQPHFIDVRFNGDHVPGSPFECKVVDLSRIRVIGDGLEKLPVNVPTAFTIDTHGENVGEFQISVSGPTQHNLKTFMNGNHHSGYRVEYTPAEVGDHTVDVRLGGHVVAGSPFLTKVYDASKVRVADIGSGVVGRPVYFSIDASQAGAGNLEIIVSVGGRNVPNYVQSEGNAKFRVNFKPSEPLTHTLSVKFNGEAVPGSPFFVKVTDSSQSMVTGASLRMTSVTQGARFSIDTKGTENADCKVTVTAPSGKKLAANITKTSDTTFEVQFQPTEVGPHQVVITLEGTPVVGSPFTCNVYDVSKVNVAGLNPGVLNKPVTFQVDASQAGEGTLELVVTTRKSSVRAEVAMRSRGVYDVTFVPLEKTSHYVNITFNEEDIPGNPFKIEIWDTQADVKSPQKSSAVSVAARGDGLKQGLVGSVNVFEIDTSGLEGNIDIKVTGPADAHIQTNVIKLDHGTYRAEYHTREVGMYKVEVLHKGAPISNKPFIVEVCDPSRVKVMDIEDGIVNREQSFRVDTTRAGHGTLNVAITAGGREVRNSIKELGPGMHKVTYTPKSDLPHKIDVYYNGHQAPGCPQIVEIRDPSHAIIAHGAGLKSTQLGKVSTFIIETGGFADAKDFDILVSAPNGSPLPVKCYQQKDGSLLVEWTATYAGSHKVDVLYEGKPVAGSPFMCQIFDASRVVLQKVKNTTFSVNEKISFTLNRRDAGYSELDVTVTSPLGRNLPIEVKGTPDGDGELIEFTPTVPGKYRIAITYGGVEVPGSPITFIAQDGGTPKISGNGLTVAQNGVMASFKIDAKGLWGRPDVRIDGPDSEPEINIEEEEEGIYVVSYLPLEIGVFDIHVRWNNKDIPGSPFHPRVVDPQKVRAIGGWDSLMDPQGRIPLVVGEEKRISVDVTDAGPGKFKVEIRGPNQMVEGQLEQTSSHRYKLSFIPPEEGDYYIYMYYNDFSLPNSPFAAHAVESGPVLDHTRVVLRGHGLTGAKVGEEAEFIIDGSDAGPGSPEVSLSGVKADISVQMIPMGNNTYRALYTPTAPGAYLLNVMWSERQVKGCPLKVTVTANCDSAKVLCSGEGLKGGTVGKEIKAFIDTRKAGPGELTAHCMGPHKMAHCELYDHRDGTFTLYIKPQEGGRHLLTVKYGGDHVQGSPYTLRIAGAPDASKVRVYGPGIEPGVLAMYQSRFICDTRGAGAGQLTVRIRGPKGAFRVEMQRESQKDRTILCKYDPTEPGDYRIEVKWSGEHVPGSPFMVLIFDTQEELTRYLQGQYSSGSAAVPVSEYFGENVTYGTGMGQMSWRGSTHEL